MTPTADRASGNGASQERSPGRAPARPLAEVAADVFRGQASPQELHETFMASTLWCQAGEHPGFEAIELDGDVLIPVFSSPEQLALAFGAVAWFSTTGADLYDMVPKGYDMALDVAGDTPLRIHTAAVHKVAKPMIVGWG